MISTLISSGSRYPISRLKIKKKVAEVVNRLGLDEIEVSIAIVGDRKIRQLNQKYRQINEPTDVLSFPFEEPRDQNRILRLGDIVISYPQARIWAAERNKLVDEVVLELVEHGILHLLGYNHDNGTQFKISTAKDFSTGSKIGSSESSKNF